MLRVVSLFINSSLFVAGGGWRFFVVCCMLFVARGWLFAVRCSRFVVRCCLVFRSLRVARLFVFVLFVCALFVCFCLCD